MTLNQKLVVLRKKAGITQGELAASLEVSRQSVHKWESGQCYPEVPKLIKLKEIFEVSIDDLLDDGVEIALPEKKRVRSVRVEESIGEKIEVSTEENKQNKNNAENIIEEIKVEVIDSATYEEEKEEETPLIEEKKKGFFGRIFGRR